MKTVAQKAINADCLDGRRDVESFTFEAPFFKDTSMSNSEEVINPESSCS